MQDSDDLGQIEDQNGNEGNDIAPSADVPSGSPEGLPSIESERSPEEEKAPEVFTSPKPPIPKSREEDEEESSDFDNSSKSQGRILDKRSKGVKSISLSESQSELTRYGDEEEEEFIEGVKGVNTDNGSGKS